MVVPNNQQQQLDVQKIAYCKCAIEEPSYLSICYSYLILYMMSDHSFVLRMNCLTSQEQSKEVDKLLYSYCYLLT